MKRLYCVLGLVVAFLISTAHVQGQDDQYIRIYDLIQQADALNNSGQVADARAKYDQAQTSLQAFQAVYPNWNSKVVNFRLAYIQAKITALGTKQTPVTPPPATATQTPTPVPSAGPSEGDRQLGILRDQIRQLETDKSALEAKLKEAFSVQPAAIDPRELSNAQERVEFLSKENALLKVSLTNQPAVPDSAAGAAAVEEARQALAEANLKLADQATRANALEAEKKALQDQLNAVPASTNSSADLDAVKKDLENANRQLADKSTAADQMARDRDALLAKVQIMQSQLDSLTPPTNVITDLDVTKNSLKETNAKLADQAGLVNQLSQERDALQARNQALQAQLGGALADQTNLTTELDATKSTLAMTSQQLADKSTQVEKLAKERDDLQTNVQTLMASAAAAEALRTENDILKKQVATSQAAVDRAADQSKKLADAEARLASLQSEAGVLYLEKTALQDRLINKPVPAPAKNVSRPADLARIKDLERQRDELQRKLESLDQQVAAKSRPTKSVVVTEGTLVAQVANMRARLDVLEAKSVPYSPEELDLFKKGPMKLVAAPPKSGAKTGGDLPPDMVPLAAEAQRDFSARKFDKAEAKYLEILRRDENNSYTLANLAAIQLEMNHLDAAEQHIQQAVKLAPDDGYSLSILGFLRFRQERYDDALDALSRAAGLDPQNAQIQNYLGVTLSHKGMRGPAETALRKALQIDPNYGDAHNNLAVIYATQKPPLMELARWHYQKALATGRAHNLELEKILNGK